MPPEAAEPAAESEAAAAAAAAASVGTVAWVNLGTAADDTPAAVTKRRDPAAAFGTAAVTDSSNDASSLWL